jgi:hypothetical protein
MALAYLRAPFHCCVNLSKLLILFGSSLLINAIFTEMKLHLLFLLRPVNGASIGALNGPIGVICPISY